MEVSSKSLLLRVFLIFTILIAFFGVFKPNPSLAADAGFALEFDGQDDYVQLWQTDLMLASGWENTKTVSLWTKPTGMATACNGVASCDVVFGDRPRWWGISRGIFGGNDKIWVWNFDGNMDLIGIDYTPGEWIHVALVHSDGQLRAFKNGIEIGNVASGMTLQPNTGAHPILHIGGFVKTPNIKWVLEGQIDEVQLWNTARTSDEISQGMFQSLAGNEAGLAAYYPMSDGSGTTLTDESINEWNGTLYDYLNGDPPLWVDSGAFDGAIPTTPPVANPQSVSTDEDSATAITLTGTDPDGDPITFIVVTQPSYGTLSGNAPDLTYSPDADYFGMDSLTFKVNDGFVDSPNAVVDITINPVNDQPVAEDDAAATNESIPVVVDVLSNDSDVDGDSLTISMIGTPSNGSVLNNGVDLSYAPNPGFIGTDVFTYTIDDGNSGTATALVSVQVNPYNEPPQAADDIAVTGEDQSVLINVLSNDTDPDGDALSITSVGSAANGSVTNNGFSVTYSPNADFNGIDSFSYTISDGNGGTASAIVNVTIDPVNDLPVAVDDTANTTEANPIVVNVLANDYDVDGDLLTINAVGTPANGSVLNGGSDITYTPNSGFTGTDVFTYTIVDNSGETATAQVNVIVDPINNPGYALEFDGIDNYVKLGDTGMIMGEGTWAGTKTISLWVNPTGATGPATTPSAGEFIAGNDRPRQFGITRAVVNGFDRIWIWNYDGNIDAIGIDFTPGEWVHIAMVHSGGTLFAYKNGVLAGSISSGPTVIPFGTADGNLYLGGSDNTRALHFKGQIDEARYWNIGLDQSTIQEWASQEVTDAHPYWANLVAYYQMNAGSGLILSDDSPFSNDGSLLGGMTDSSWIISGIW